METTPANSSTFVTEPALVRIAVSDDRITASLVAANETAAAGITSAEAIDHLQKAGIVVTAQVTETIGRLASATGKISLASPVLAAEGVRPIHDAPARIEMQPALLHKADESNLSHYERSSIITITEGQVLGHLRPRTHGKDGMDVFGHTLHRRKEPDHGVLGKNVELAADGTTIKAKTPGSLQWDGKLLAVETILEIAGSVDFSTGHINFTGDVIIRGSVADLFKVKGNVVCVFGTVEAAQVHAGKNLEVHGGIVGKDKGQYRAGQNLSAKYITNANIQTGNDIVIQSEVANTRVLCGGKLSIEHGALIAGHATVNGGIQCVALGSAAQVNTLVEVGFDQELLTTFEQRRAEIQVQEGQIEKTRQLIDPLMRNPKILTAEQREKATELLYTADGIEEAIKSNVNEICQASQVAAQKCKPVIVVSQTVHPGVTIRFPWLEARVTQTLRGPLKIYPTDVDGEPKIVYQSAGGSTHPLETRHVRNPTLEALGRFLASKSHTPPTAPSAAA